MAELQQQPRGKKPNKHSGGGGVIVVVLKMRKKITPGRSFSKINTKIQRENVKV